MLKFCEFKLLNSISIFSLPHAPLPEAYLIFIVIYRTIEKENAFTELNAIRVSCSSFRFDYFLEETPSFISGKCFHSIRSGRDEIANFSRGDFFEGRRELLHV